MTATDPALFYTGLVADLYAPLRSDGPPDPAPYARFIERHGQPALELGCGHGEPLLDLRAMGLDIEGVDSSPDMLDRCRAAAADRGLDVLVHCQRMQDMRLDRSFRSVFLAGATFNLLPDDEAAAAALSCIRAALAPDGAALIPLFVPEPTRPEAFGTGRALRAADGTEQRCTPISETRDEWARTQVTVLRYESAGPTGTARLDREWLLHWYSQQQFTALAEGAGLRVARMLDPAGGAAVEDATSFVALLTPMPLRNGG